MEIEDKEAIPIYNLSSQLRFGVNPDLRLLLKRLRPSFQADEDPWQMVLWEICWHSKGGNLN